MNILLLSDSFNGYGAEHILKWLGNMLCYHNNKVTFCSIFDSERNKDLNEDAKYFQMQFPRGIYNKNYFIGGVRFLRILCKEERFDYVITFHTNPFLMALLAKPFCRFKIIHSERDNPYNRDTFASRLKMNLYRFANKIVFQTEGAQHYFNSNIKKKSIIIPNPISVPTIQWDGLNNKTIASVGRLFIRYKRQDVLLKAFKKVIIEYPDYKLVLYGDGVDREALEQLAFDLQIDKNVVFKGKVDNVYEQLKSDGIFVLSSDSEGMPNALMEAMALGMPVISTDCEPGGAKALIDDGENGLLVERASVEKLADAILKIIEDKTIAQKLGANARKKMSLFTPQHVGSQWIKYIKR